MIIRLPDSNAPAAMYSMGVDTAPGPVLPYLRRVAVAELGASGILPGVQHTGLQ